MSSAITSDTITTGGGGPTAKSGPPPRAGGGRFAAADGASSAAAEPPPLKTAAGLGAIHADAIYPLEVFRRLAGLDDWAIRKAVRSGLKVRVWGRRKFVLGRDVLDYMGTLPSGSTK